LISGDEAVHEIGQLLLMLWRDLGDRSAEEGRRSRGDEQRTMNGALFVQLTFDPDSVSLGDPEIRLD
jgi:hypothetical protein